MPLSFAEVFEAAYIDCCLLEGLLSSAQLATNVLPGSTTYGQDAVVQRKARDEQHVPRMVRWLLGWLTT